jgi:quinol monooxygenase YgiN
LSFHQENIPAFLDNFELVKNQIRNFPGNRLLELYQDKTNSSELFNEVWDFTKKLFNNKPEAWSVDKLASLV